MHHDHDSHDAYPQRRTGRPSGLATAFANELHFSGHTYADAAALTGVSRATIARWATRIDVEPPTGAALTVLHGRQTDHGWRPFDALEVAHEHAIRAGTYVVPRPTDPSLRAALARLAADPRLARPDTLPRVLADILAAYGASVDGEGSRTTNGGWSAFADKAGMVEGDDSLCSAVDVIRLRYDVGGKQ